MLKAKAIAREHSITGPFFMGQTSRNAHSQYPLLLPIAAAGIFEATGSDDDRVVRPLYSLIAIAFLVVLRAAMQRVAGVSAAAVITAAVAWLPQFAADNDGGMTSAYSDVPLIAFVSLALLTIVRGDAEKHPWRFGLQLAFIACVKNEGVVLVIALLMLSRFTWKSLIPVVGTLAALAAWHAQVPLEYDENYPQLLRPRSQAVQLPRGREGASLAHVGLARMGSLLDRRRDCRGNGEKTIRSRQRVRPLCLHHDVRRHELDDRGAGGQLGAPPPASPRPVRRDADGVQCPERTKSMKPRSTSSAISFTRTRSPTSSPFGAAHELAFDRRVEDAHPGALRRGAGDDAVEVLADAGGEQQRGGGLAHLALDLVRRVLLLGAVRGERAELVVACRAAARPASAAFTRRCVMRSG